jgi:hypothetical protein
MEKRSDSSPSLASRLSPADLEQLFGGQENQQCIFFVGKLQKKNIIVPSQTKIHQQIPRKRNFKQTRSLAPKAPGH